MNKFKKYNYKILQFILLSIIGIIIFLFLLKSINIKDINNIFRNLNIIYIFLSFIIYILIYFLRARRFSFLLNNKISFNNIFIITCIHNFFNMILPARFGEFSYSIMLKKESINISESMSHIIISRIYDLFGILFLFFISLSFFLDYKIKIYSIIGLITVVIIFYIFYFYFYKLLLIINKIKIKNKIINRIKNFFEKIFENINYLDNNKKVWLLFNSLIINFLMFFFGYVLILGMSIKLSIWAVFVGGALAFLTTILPIQGFFNLGTMELGWVFGFIVVGLNIQEATTSGIVYHLINIIFTTILFVCGYFFYLFNTIKNVKQ